MGDVVPSLPVPLDRITAPDELNPSSFADLIRCPLSCIHRLREASQLPPHPMAILGTAIHEAKRRVHTRAYASEDEAEEDAIKELQAVLSEQEGKLLTDARTRSLVPLKNCIDSNMWIARVSRLRNWARALSYRKAPFLPSSSDETHAVDGTRAKAARTPTTKIPLGAERLLYLPALRLSGQPDYIRRDTMGVVHVTDFKTGQTRGSDESPPLAATLQVQLYAVMLESIEPGVSLKLWIEGAERMEVPWNDDVREEIQSKLSEVLQRLPKGSALDTSSVAQTGDHCKRCRIRHHCPSYREQAPAWWRKVTAHHPVAPFDIWGNLLAVDQEAHGTNRVTLRDRAGRLVFVSGLDPRRELPPATSGSEIWFFDLKPTERLPHHGAFHHPLNFHEKAQSRVWQNALAVSVFKVTSVS